MKFVTWRSRESRGFHYSVQIILENEVEGNNDRRAGVVGFVVCAGRVGRCVEGEHNGGIRVRRDRI